jgi:uncharacterized membrane protein
MSIWNILWLISIPVIIVSCVIALILYHCDNDTGVRVMVVVLILETIAMWVFVIGGWR